MFHISVTQMKINFEYLHLTGIFIELSSLNVKLFFSICGSIFSIIHTVLGNMSSGLFITSVTTVNGLDNQKCA